MAPPLFLLAPPRSFTSLFNAMLGQHPQAYGLPELCLFNGPYLKDLWIRDTDEIARHGATRHGLLRAVAEIYGGEQTEATVKAAQHWCAARQEYSSAEVYRELAEKLSPLMLVEKSPSYTIDIQRMVDMETAFPDARYLHLIRHPVAQGKSVMKMNDGAFALFVNSFDFLEDRAIVDPQFAWHDLNINILNFLDSIPEERKLSVRGEDLMSDPPSHLRGICRWLGLRDDDDAVEEMMHTERSPFACLGPLSALFGNDPNFLRNPIFRPHKVKVPKLCDALPWRDDGQGLYPEVVALAREFGYS